MTRTSPSVLAVFFLLLSLCLMQRIGAVPVEPEVEPEAERRGEDEEGIGKTIDQIILDSYGGPAAEEAAEKSRLIEEGVETEGMDTLLTPGQAALLHGEHRFSKRRQSKLVTLWPGGVVPYDLSGLPAKHHDMMMEAFRDWERDTCVSFVPAQPQHQHKIFFTTGDGCRTYLGMIDWSEQAMTLGHECHSKRLYLHELGHALGLVHEHQLPQRDQYVDVNFSNVQAQFRDQLTKYPASLIPDAEKVTYSYRSIMHYGKYAYSRSYGRQTISAKDKSKEPFMGTDDELAPIDIEVVNLLYNCDGRK